MIGVALTIGMFRLAAMKQMAGQMPKAAQRLFSATFFLLPPLIVALVPQPRLPWSAPAGIVAVHHRWSALITLLALHAALSPHRRVVPYK